MSSHVSCWKLFSMNSLHLRHKKKKKEEEDLCTVKQKLNWKPISLKKKNQLHYLFLALLWIEDRNWILGSSQFNLPPLGVLGWRFSWDFEPVYQPAISPAFFISPNTMSVSMCERMLMVGGLVSSINLESPPNSWKWEVMFIFTIIRVYTVVSVVTW